MIALNIHQLFVCEHKFMVYGIYSLQVKMAENNYNYQVSQQIAIK